MSRHNWTHEEEILLEQLSQSHSEKEIAETLGLTVVQVRNKKHHMGIRRTCKSRILTDDEKQEIYDTYFIYSDEEIRAMYNITYGQLEYLKMKLGLRRKTHKWSDEEQSYLIEEFDNLSNKELCDALGVNRNQLLYKCRELGLHRERREDFEGRTIGNLTVIGPDTSYDDGGDARRRRWICRCNICGNVFTINHFTLKYNDPYSHCKCSQTGENAHRYKHGGTRSTLYRRWVNMKTRCYNPNDDSYRFYGGRGIKVCDEWLSFENYRDWCVSNGWDETKSVDRIDNDKWYSPDNCRIIPLADQPKNRRNNKKQYIPPEDTK